MNRPLPQAMPDADPALAARATLDAWITAFNRSHPKEVASLYAPDAVLWGTFADALITTPAGVLDYFERALDGPQPPTVELEAVHWQVHGTLAVAAGAYALHTGPSNPRQRVAARFTLVLEQGTRGWRILHHHSSLMPTR